MPSVEIGGATLSYLENGEGRPVVLVHGSASDSRTWDLQIGALAEHFRTIAYSRRYHRPNAPIESGDRYSLARHVDDLEALLGALGAAPAHLVGHSYGALISLLLAARAPHRVSRLVLAEPPVVGLFVSVPPTPRELLRLALRRPRTAVGVVKLGGLGLGPAASAFERGEERVAMKLLGHAILGRRAFRGLSEDRASQVRDNLIAEELLHEEAMPRLDPGLLETVRAPTLLVGGERSPAVFARFLDHLQRELPRARRVTIPGASHLMHEDQAERYSSAVLGFLRSGAD